MPQTKKQNLGTSRSVTKLKRAVERNWWLCFTRKFSIIWQFWDSINYAFQGGQSLKTVVRIPWAIVLRMYWPCDFPQCGKLEYIICGSGADSLEAWQTEGPPSSIYSRMTRILFSCHETAMWLSQLQSKEARTDRLSRHKEENQNVCYQPFVDASNFHVVLWKPTLTKRGLKHKQVNWVCLPSEAPILGDKEVRREGDTAQRSGFQFLQGYLGSCKIYTWYSSHLTGRS